MDYGNWLEAAAKRLAADGFTIQENVEDKGLTFRMVAHRSRFELSKMGNSETFFVFAEVIPPVLSDLRAFSTEAFDYAIGHKASSRPCGLFESVWCYSVALTEKLGQEAAIAIEETAPPKHWAAAEVPVVYDTQSGALTYFEKTPLWGAAYYRGFRKSIQNYLG